MDQKQSGLGIASFVISTAAGVIMFMVVVIAGLMQASTPGGIDANSSSSVLIGLVMIALSVADVVAVGLGIAGLVQRDRKKVFPILGLVFSVVTIIFVIFCAILGNMK